MTKHSIRTSPRPAAAARDQALKMSSDSVRQLPPTAQRILAAARHILRERGFAAMSLRAVATEAGEVKPTIAYYYGNKAGLVSMIVKSLMSESDSLAREGSENIPDGEAKVVASVEKLRQLSLQWDTTLEFLEILPWAARHDEMSAAMQNLYTWAGEFNASSLAGEDTKASASELLSWGVLTAAVLDGLAIQKVVGVDDDLLDSAWDEWRRILLLVRSTAGMQQIASV